MLGAAGGKAPGLLHRFVLHAQHATDLVAFGGHQGVAQTRARPPRPTQAAAVRISPSAAVTVDVAAKADA